MTTHDRPEAWGWPKVPLSMVVADHVSDEPPSVLEIGVLHWKLRVSGRLANLYFRATAVGRLQQTLIIATQEGKAATSIESYARIQDRYWSIYERLLVGGPDVLLDLWDELALDASVTRIGKTLLSYACLCNVGPWSTLDLPRVKALNTRTKQGLDANVNQRLNREKLLTPDEERRVVRLLDESAVDEELSEAECEGHVALASMYMHGKRPVQVLALRVHNVTPYTDADGKLSFIVSFHRAKQRGKAKRKPAELARIFPPEWSAPLERLLAFAGAAGRTRLFGVPDASAMYSRVRSFARDRGFEVNLKSNWFRHSFAQRLADRNVPSKKIGEAMGHVGKNSPRIYTIASLETSRRVNQALGASKVYGKVVSLANGTVTIDELLAAPPDQQIGGVVGARLVAGIGLCKRGQPNCPWDPVISCYGCSKYIPSANRAVHVEASQAMREQLRENMKLGIDEKSPMLMQLNGALEGIRGVIDDIRGREGQA